MTMTESPTAAPAPKPAKPKRKMQRVKRAPAAVAVEPGSKLAGITPRDCPMACTAKMCVISGRDICAHPMKGGLQANMQNDMSLRRSNEARNILGKQKIDLTK